MEVGRDGVGKLRQVNDGGRQKIKKKRQMGEGEAKVETAAGR